MQLVEKMTSMGCQLSIVTYTSLLDGFLKANKGKIALSIFTPMVEKGCSPDTVTCIAFTDRRVKEGKIDKAMEVQEKMANMACQPNIVTYNLLLQPARWIA